MDEVNYAANSIGCQVGKFPFNYLGLPIGANMTKIQAWNPVIDKIKSRFSDWKMRMMSFGGRLVLIKSGLNVGSLKSKNLSLLGKWWWRFKTDTDAFWVKIIRSIHGANGGLEMGSNSCCSSANGLFSVKKLSTIIDEQLLPCPTQYLETMRNNLVPRKLEIFVWRASKKRIPVRIELDKRGVDLHSVRCPVCDDDVESVDHCLVFCKFSLEIWSRVHQWWKLGQFSNFSTNEILRGNANSSNVMSKFGKQIWQAVEWVSAYYIWKNRNNVIFHNKSWSVPVAINEIQIKSFQWISQRSKGRQFNWFNWISDPSIYLTIVINSIIQCYQQLNWDRIQFVYSLSYRSYSDSGSESNHVLKSRGASHPREELNKLAGLCSDTRSTSRPSPVREPCGSKDTDVESKNRNSLEEDIEQLQMRLQQEKSVRMLLERALGRTSSTLSPGHRHSTNKTKELIAEIELLEEEVVNREQHVLTLYRTIFEQCVSRPSSQQSSVPTSPAHVKKESRKHPTIISSTFCSSNRFHFRNFHALSTARKGNVLQSKTRHSSLFHCEANKCFETTSSDDVKRKRDVSAMTKPSIQLTLKEHLYECPNRLSEEMVKCMAAAYCWLRSSSSANSEQKKSSSLCKLSTKLVLPQRASRQDSKSRVEISWLSTDKISFSRASYAINNYRLLVEQVEKLNLSKLETNAKTAFWINMYNSIIMHAYLAYGIPYSSLRRLALFHKAAYRIDGHIINANAIEQAIFRFHTPRVGKWLETILSTALWKKSGDERQRIGTKFGLKHYQPLLCFALCTGASSDPVLKVYTPSSIKEELEVAKREFLQSNVIVKKSKKIFIPKLLERFAKETDIAPDSLLNWIAENVDKKLGDSIRKCIEQKTSKKTSQIIEWLPYNSKFKYVFSNNLTEKPWWL
ncbi:uncharacterized protein [Rutidosis leptorrhynchoides]|uniref:uncharacterized protein n=1 Tax=Rutidosis leptorrhynchoides TaxID=125765 RepID=UPI003A995ADF